eukprot:m.41761 g.41761  ORF g.41761 m.41761 type:complete len:382 (+) comp8249_c0_seq2:2471-3616(+)
MKHTWVEPAPTHFTSKMDGSKEQRLSTLTRHIIGSSEYASPPQLPACAEPWGSIDMPASDVRMGRWIACSDTPIAQLSRGDIPAVVIRNVLSREECTSVLTALGNEDLYPRDFVPYLSMENRPTVLKEGRESGWVDLAGQHERFDIGTSLGNLGSNPGKFFGEARTMLTKVLAAVPKNPITTLYDALSILSGGRTVSTAEERSGEWAGCQYGVGIFRSHLPNFGYSPHIDSVRYREKRTGYDVYKHSTQLGGIVLLQAPDQIPSTGSNTPGYISPDTRRYHDAILYQAPCTNPAVASFIERETDYRPNGAYLQIRAKNFREFAIQEQLNSCKISLQPGDMYFFKADSIHEIPAFGGDKARMNLATFIGFDEEHDKPISVWS